MKKIIFFVFIFGHSAVFACKPCGSFIDYSIHNNTLIFTGKVTKVGIAPPHIIKENKTASSRYQQKGYCIPVEISVSKVLSKNKSDLIGPKKIFKTQSCYQPPCKGIVEPKINGKYLFFPEDFGNCSLFAFELNKLDLKAVQKKIKVKSNR